MKVLLNCILFCLTTKCYAQSKHPEAWDDTIFLKKNKITKYIKYEFDNLNKTICNVNKGIVGICSVYYLQNNKYHLESVSKEIRSKDTVITYRDEFSENGERNSSIHRKFKIKIGDNIYLEDLFLDPELNTGNAKKSYYNVLGKQDSSFYSIRDRRKSDTSSLKNNYSFLYKSVRTYDATGFLIKIDEYSNSYPYFRLQIDSFVNQGKVQTVYTTEFDKNTGAVSKKYKTLSKFNNDGHGVEVIKFEEDDRPADRWTFTYNIVKGVITQYSRYFKYSSGKWIEQHL